MARDAISARRKPYSRAQAVKATPRKNVSSASGATITDELVAEFAEKAQTRLSET